MLITKKSIITGKDHQMDLPVTEEQLTRWQRGELIQNVMPELTPVQREFLISGMTPEEQEEIFGNGSQDDDDDYDDYYNNDNGPTGHGDDCYSDADPGL